MRSVLALFGLLALFSAAPLRAADPDPEWAYKQFIRPALPAVRKSDRIRNPIDAFVLARLEAKGMTLSPDADPSTILRRVTFDLTGLPPTPAELAEFLNDKSAGAYAKVVDRLLKSSRYGEKAALPWLDQARYAESDGFKADDFRPNAWRYRDYVVDSMNRDTPYDRFIHEQIAGDELFPGDANALVATGFMRHYQSEYNAINLDERRQDILNDLTDVAGQAFLGLTLGCAKCHDHKFDPITHEDYYRIQAFFAGYNPVEIPMMAPAQREKYEVDLKAWNAKTAAIRGEIEEFLKPFRKKFNASRGKRFPDEYAALLTIAEDKRTPMQKQIACMIEAQVYSEKDMLASVKDGDKVKLDALLAKLKEFGPAPSTLGNASTMTDIGPIAPPVRRLKRGNWRYAAEEVEPGFLSAIDDRTADIVPSKDGKTTGRRTALAFWLTNKDNPLTARVEVNRLWQQHFGFGIVRTPADFGVQGERPTHPELLDWLASEFVEKKWSIKEMHRLIVTSTTYRQQSIGNGRGAEIDPSNRLLWKQNRKRLEGETLRDAVLAVSGLLNEKAGGPSIFPELPDEMKSSKWSASKTEAEKHRRSIYVAVRRNQPFPLFVAFDGTDRCEACSSRFVTTNANQALALLNEKQMVKQAESLAGRIKKDAGDDAAKQVVLLFEMTLGRVPSDSEKKVAIRYLERQPLADLCHAVLNINEFVYVD